MTEKKTKLTISGNPKKSFKSFSTSTTYNKKTVIIDKQLNKPLKKTHLNKQFGSKTNPNFNRGTSFKNTVVPKVSSTTSDFERRKLAEQRATKRLKSDGEVKDKKTKTGFKKRELKLTVSRALSDQIETRERSLASVKRARQKG